MKNGLILLKAVSSKSNIQLIKTNEKFVNSSKLIIIKFDLTDFFELCGKSKYTENDVIFQSIEIKS